jgi:hypothetical protein
MEISHHTGDLAIGGKGIAQIEMARVAGKVGLQFGPLGGLVATEVHGEYGFFRTGA